jgi:hypothetical protein
MSDAKRTQVFHAIRARDVQTVHRILSEHPEIRDAPAVMNTWLEQAAKAGSTEMVQALLSLGFPINAVAGIEESTALTCAVDAGDVEMVRYLLDRGADPNLDRPLIAAISLRDEAIGLQIAQILVRAGADVNTQFPWFGDARRGYTPLAWAEANDRGDIAAYLRTAARGGSVPPKDDPERDDVVAYFSRAIGPVAPRGLQSIVSTGDRVVAVHAVEAGRGDGLVTLFTSGISRAPMRVPPGAEAYRFAELYIQLPAGWPTVVGLSGDPSALWPYVWLRAVASYVCASEAWLGEQAAIVTAGAAEFSVPNTAFVAMLLVADQSFVRGDQSVVNLYRMMPLHREEYMLEQRQGIGALLRAFDRSGVPTVVDLHRPSAVS